MTTNEKDGRSRVYVGDSDDSDDDIPQPPTASEPVFDDRPNGPNQTTDIDVVRRRHDPVEPLGYDYASEAQKWAEWKGSPAEEDTHRDEEFYMKPLVVEVCSAQYLLNCY